jgi:hypothetical protein
MLVAAFFFSATVRGADPEEGISTGRFITGGVIGTAVGFGIGHGIQGRYLPLGLVFSLGEAAGLIAYFADSTTTFDSTTGFGRTRHVGAVGTIGGLVWLGLHVWEIVDVWVKGNELHKKWEAGHRRGALLLPATFARGEIAPGLSLAMRF